MNRPRVLLIQEVLKRYRDPIYSLINRQVDLTVGYSISTEVQSSSYRILYLPCKQFGCLTWHIGLRRIINQYDVVIIIPQFKLIRLIVLPFLPHKPKIITWSIGIHVTQSRTYDLTQKPLFKDWLMEWVQDRCDACIFYMPDPIRYWKTYRDIDERKYFVAHNTVMVSSFDNKNTDRSIILFVGALVKRKGLGELIRCYAKAKERVRKMPPLVIIGQGEEREMIEKQITALHLEKHIRLEGPIFDDDKLKVFFTHSIICVSPKQAGLTVLSSLGYGVPFITRWDAISGGEKMNIIDGKTGFFYNTEKELIDILVQTTTNPQLFDRMSENAKDYYSRQATPEIMAQGVVDAIMYTLSK